jgi:hypothetical protein
MKSDDQAVKIGRCVDGLFAVANTLAQLMDWPSEDVPRLCVAAGAQMFYGVLDTYDKRLSEGRVGPEQAKMANLALRKVAADVMRAMDETKARIAEELERLPPSEPPSGVSLN